MKKFTQFINEQREPKGRWGSSVEDYPIRMNGRVAKMIKKSGPVFDTRKNEAFKKANDYLISVGNKHGIKIDKLHNDITGYYAMLKPGQNADKISQALTEYEKTIGKQVK